MARKQNLGKVLAATEAPPKPAPEPEAPAPAPARVKATPEPAQARGAALRVGTDGLDRGPAGRYRAVGPRQSSPVPAVKTTLELPEDQHDVLRDWTRSAEREIKATTGLTGYRLQPQHLVRALVAEMLNDETLYRRVVRELTPDTGSVAP